MDNYQLSKVFLETYNHLVAKGYVNGKSNLKFDFVLDSELFEKEEGVYIEVESAEDILYLLERFKLNENLTIKKIKDLHSQKGLFFGDKTFLFLELI